MAFGKSKMDIYVHVLLIACMVVCNISYVSAQAAGLRVGFYSRTCPLAETIVRDTVAKRFRVDKSITAALLRMHFHDCFVRGCDASLLLDGKGGNLVEKDSVPNLTVRGYELIDEIKRNLELKCRGTVSCADIVALATRDSVKMAGGPDYKIPTGRGDGRVSSFNEVFLPGPQESVAQAAAEFSVKGLAVGDMVALLGAHTVGVAHCSFFSDRVYDFQGTGRPDPTMDRALVAKLRRICPAPTSSSNRDPTVFLDQNTTMIADNSFFRQVQLHRGIMQIDQELNTDRSSRGLVNTFATNPRAFSTAFANALIKMGKIGVLTGRNGEVRHNCRVVNPTRH